MTRPLSIVAYVVLLAGWAWFLNGLDKPGVLAVALAWTAIVLLVLWPFRRIL